MAKKFGIDGTLGYGSAVHSNVLAMFTATVLVDNLRKTLLTHTTLSGDKH